ncbi:PA2169 family four-helix-bundle protein [Rubritalea spongiae]|uniref:PA2169 family four-helix-bundle protein n=1 Tax=Rubritalea spongiae TaxID=430797 RepID=A0ABW5E148_9BACT
MNNNTLTERQIDCIGTCNSLLRGELSAVETYEKAIEKFAHDEEVATLRRIKDEHQTSVLELRENIRQMGGEPDDDSGAWGSFANTVQGAANLLGDDSAVAALKQGEKHGLKEYEDAIEESSTMPECRSLIETQWLPRVKSHIRALDALD